MTGVGQYFLLAFTALLPLVNPFGSALVFLGMVGEEPDEVYRQLARRVAAATLVFLLSIEYLGSVVLGFFGIALPMVQVAGGLVIAATAWNLLFQKDADAHTRDKQQETGGDPAGQTAAAAQDLSGRIFYPFTFPLTAGPGCLVVVLTLSAKASEMWLLDKAAAHAGIGMAILCLCALVYGCYGYSPRIVKVMSPSMAHGVLRVISFLLLCLGIQLFWNGLLTLRHG